MKWNENSLCLPAQASKRKSNKTQQLLHCCFVGCLLIALCRFLLFLFGSLFAKWFDQKVFENGMDLYDIWWFARILLHIVGEQHKEGTSDEKTLGARAVHWRWMLPWIHLFKGFGSWNCAVRSRNGTMGKETKVLAKTTTISFDGKTWLWSRFVSFPIFRPRIRSHTLTQTHSHTLSFLLSLSFSFSFSFTHFLF